MMKVSERVVRNYSDHSCACPELLGVREMTLGRGAILDKLICEPFRERLEVMKGDILSSSGTGEGAREIKRDELPGDANPLGME